MSKIKGIFVNKNKKISKKKKIIIGISILIIISIIGASIGYGFYLYTKMEKVEIDRDEVLTEDGKKEEYKDYITNIALFGTDTTNGTEGLSDSIMILTINTKTKSIKLSSIMRDSYVDIPGHGQNIINMAMMDGGPQLMLKTINTNFNLDLDKFIAVNLNSLPKIIDKVGGVDFSIDQGELNNINGIIEGLNEVNNTNSEKIKTTGMQHFDGIQATAFCRIRHAEGSDFKRTERQRQVFELIFNKLKKLSYGDLDSFIKEVSPLVTTNLSYTEIVSVGSKILSLGDKEITPNRFPNDGDHWSTGTFGDYKLNINKEATAKKMNDFIYN